LFFLIKIHHHICTVAEKNILNLLFSARRVLYFIFLFLFFIFYWDYSGMGILGIDGVCVLLGAIPFLE